MPGTASEVYVDGTPTNGSNVWIDALVWGGAWADTSGLPTTGGPVTISYTAMSGADPYNVLGGAAMTWSSAGLTALGQALAGWEAVASLDFVQAVSGQADVWFWQGTDAAADGALGWSEVPAYSAGEPLYLVCNGQDASWTAAGLALGGYAYITLIHELGHLLGLAHPHDGGGAADGENFPGVTSPFNDYGDYSLNQGIFTTMSYNDGWASQYPSHNSLSYGWQATPMALDIAAIQAIYGANTTYASGANTYTLPSYNVAGTYWTCIWDTGGADLITNAGSSLGCIINLTAAPLTGANAGGFVSYAAGIVGGFTIANGVVIENATGGSGNDTITGNAAANTLIGGDGNDSLTGGAGHDTITGGNGTDTAVFSITLGGATISYNSGTAEFTIQSTEGTDVLAQIEFFQFSNTVVAASTYIPTDVTAPTVTITDNVSGTATGNITYSLDFSEAVTGLTASDFSVTNGTVTAVSGSGSTYSVVVAPAAGVEGTLSLSLNAGAVTDAAGNANAQANADGQAIAVGLVRNGTTGADSLVGSALADTLNGSAGNDTLVGGAGNDLLTGGTGVDFASYASASEDLSLSLMDAALVSSAFGTDTFSTIEGLIGGSGNDSLTGDALANLLYGGEGADTLSGGAGNDVLRGDGGTDTASYSSASAGVVVSLAVIRSQVTGGAGADTLLLIENLTGSNYNDTLTGNALANVLSGGDGSDVLTGGAGADTLLGGAGNDIFVVTLSTELALGEVITGGEGLDELRFAAKSASTLTLTEGVAVDSVVIGTGTLAQAVSSGKGALNVDASAAANGLSITGNAGANILTGSAYDDTLIGGLGMDQLIGGIGEDVFVFNTVLNAKTNRDTITDYSVLDDQIHLDNAVMAGLGLTTGGLNTAAFTSGNFTSAQDASDRIIYNSTTGLLYYDADGAGGAAAISFAQLTAGLSLTHQEFEII